MKLQFHYRSIRTRFPLLYTYVCIEDERDRDMYIYIYTRRAGFISASATNDKPPLAYNLVISPFAIGAMRSFSSVSVRTAAFHRGESFVLY